MNERSDHSALRREHTAEAIRQRIGAGPERGYLSDAVLGGIDGGVTTFAIVAGAVGGGLPGAVVVVLGLANLIADGFSMAASNYLSVKSEHEEVERTRREEEQHIRHVPDGEREEIRQIFASKGFTGELLEQIVAVITARKELWVDTMLTEEHGLALVNRNPLRAGLATFGAFLAVGVLPLLPFLLGSLDQARGFSASIAVTAAAFTAVGMLKGRILSRSIARSGAETLLIGGIAAALAYGVGHVLRQMYASSIPGL